MTTRNEYQANGLSEPGTAPQNSIAPPADPVPPGWASVDECLWGGHRFVLMRDVESGGHRITVDGLEVWSSPDPDPEAAAEEMARRMGRASEGDLADGARGTESPELQPRAGGGEVLVDRRPLLDDWQRSPTAAVRRAREIATDLAYLAAYRVVHPVRTGRALAGLWFAGAWWLVVRWVLWTFDADETGRQSRAKALRAPSPGRGPSGDRTADKTPLEWRADHRQTVYRRLRGQLLVAGLGAGGWIYGAARAWSRAGEWRWFWWTPGLLLSACLVAAVTLVPMLVGRLVRPAEAGPVLDRPITVRRVPDLRRNPGLILDGFEGLGGRRTADAYRRQREQGTTACDWESEPMATYAGDGKTPVGLLCKVRTPEPARVMLKAAKEPEAVMAQAIGRSADQVKLSYDEDDPANVVTVFVGLRQLKDMTNIAWPLANRRARRVNIYEPVPFGYDEYGQTLSVTLNGKHALIGGATETGKSSGARALIAAAMLDPRVRLYAYFKIGPDAHPFTPIAHRVRSGNDAEDVRILVADLTEIIEEAKRRGEFQQRHPELFPEGGVTEAAWSAVEADPILRAELGPSGLDQIIVYIDECRFFFLDPEVGPLLEWLCAQARSLGITVILATQYPDKHAVPTSIKSNLLFRACLLVKGEAGQRVVLGDGVVARAYVPRMLPRKGMCYTTAPEWAARGAVRSRFFWLPLPDAHQVLVEAATERRRRGRLTGTAAGETPPDPSEDTILDHIAALPPFGERIHGQDLAILLGEHHAAYAKLGASRVLAMLRDHGLETRQVETEVRHGPDAGQRRNRTGIHRDDFDTVYRRHLDARDAAEASARSLPTWADLDPGLHPDADWGDTSDEADIDTDIVDQTETDWADTEPGAGDDIEPDIAPPSHDRRAHHAADQAGAGWGWEPDR